MYNVQACMCARLAQLDASATSIDLQHTFNLCKDSFCEKEKLREENALLKEENATLKKETTRVQPLVSPFLSIK